MDREYRYLSTFNVINPIKPFGFVLNINPFHERFSQNQQEKQVIR